VCPFPEVEVKGVEICGFGGELGLYVVGECFFEYGEVAGT
jgi:hypothetical protein